MTTFESLMREMQQLPGSLSIESRRNIRFRTSSSSLETRAARRLVEGTLGRMKAPDATGVSQVLFLNRDKSLAEREYSTTASSIASSLRLPFRRVSPQKMPRPASRDSPAHLQERVVPAAHGSQNPKFEGHSCVFLTHGAPVFTYLYARGVFVPTPSEAGATQDAHAKGKRSLRKAGKKHGRAK